MLFAVRKENVRKENVCVRTCMNNYALHKQHVFTFHYLTRSMVCYLVANIGFHTKTGVTFNFIELSYEKGGWEIKLKLIKQCFVLSYCLKTSYMQSDNRLVLLCIPGSLSLFFISPVLFTAFSEKPMETRSGIFIVLKRFW